MIPSTSLQGMDTATFDARVAALVADHGGDVHAARDARLRSATRNTRGDTDALDQAMDAWNAALDRLDLPR